mmetsp:Transcript_19917/g.50888  ORF Transcript_19917/g.50888 Transcript_19917/m.50888 type:complete len:219 (-) Transcript_19917:228-884(-)
MEDKGHEGGVSVPPKLDHHAESNDDGEAGSVSLLGPHPHQSADMLSISTAKRKRKDEEFHPRKFFDLIADGIFKCKVCNQAVKLGIGGERKNDLHKTRALDYLLNRCEPQTQEGKELQDRIRAHYGEGTRVLPPYIPSHTISFDEVCSPEEDTAIRRAILSFIFSANLTIDVIETQAFRDLILSLRPNYSLPSAQEIAAEDVKSIYKEKKRQKMMEQR